MKRLLVLSRDHEAYARHIRERLPAASLSRLEIFSYPTIDALKADTSGASPTLQLDTVDLAFAVPTLIKPFLPSLTSLRWLQCMWAGVEPLLDPSLPRIYVLTNVRGVFGPLMSEFIFTYVLLLQRKVLEKLADQRAHTWDNTPTGRLAGKRLGVLGVGSIGAHVAATAKHFGMTTVGYSRAKSDSKTIDEWHHEGALAAFAAAGCDFIVSTLPQTPSTRRLLGADFFSALKRSAVFFNVGRGAVVDERALFNALSAGTIAAAVIDVCDEEPLPRDHFLWDAPNIFITSHTAAVSFPEDIAQIFVDNYQRYEQGQELRYRFDYDKGY